MKSQIMCKKALLTSIYLENKVTMPVY